MRISASLPEVAQGLSLASYTASMRQNRHFWIASNGRYHPVAIVFRL